MKKQENRLGTHSPEFALLGFIYEQPNHGYNLHQQLVQELGYVWHSSQSQTYAILKRLATQGDISSTVQEQEKLPSRQIFRITETGRQRFEAWIRSPSGSSVRAIRVEFISRLYFAKKFFPGELSRMVSAQEVEIETALERLDKIKNTIPPGKKFNRLGLDLRIRQLRSLRDWLTDCKRILKIGG
jgi:PadR family transcriptional regulator AphA